MRFKTLSGKTRWLNCNKYKVDWNKPERSKPQFLVKKFLEPYWKNYLVYSELPVAGTRLKIDLYNSNLKLAIEIDGKSHIEYIPHFHKNRIGYLNSIKRDTKKEEWCRINDIKLIRIFDSEASKINYTFFVEKFGIYL